jgi:integrase
MAKGCKGIKYIKDDIWLIDCQVNGRRVQERIRANSLKEAKIIRQEKIVELRKQASSSQTERERLNADISEAWQALEGDILSDGVCKKNTLRHRITFRRFFEGFRSIKYPHVKSVSQISSTYLHDYKSYFVNELGHNPRGGWRAELICVKSMIRRLVKLNFIRKEIIASLDEIKRPPGEKQPYVHIPNSKLKEMLDFIKSDRPDYYNIVYYIMRVGRRIGESLQIERTDVGWDGIQPNRINIRPETTKMREVAPLERVDNELAEIILDAYRIGSKRKTKFLFCNRLGKKCSQGTLQKYLRRVSKQIVGFEITPHYFRRRFLTECGKANVSQIDAMNIAGIKDADVVKAHYQYATEDGQDMVLAVTRL